MNTFALLIFLIIGITLGWVPAFMLLGGYLLAFFLIGFNLPRRRR